jgi:dGTPase
MMATAGCEGLRPYTLGETMARNAEGPLRHLATPEEGEWVERVYGGEGDGDPRGAFERDRDRILYSESFRRLAHKTQVFIVTESDLFCTRMLHSLEAAQIARSLAASLGLQPDLAEAICLGHDVGHTPFGHIGEKTLEELLEGHAVWNSNEHSLRVLDQLELQYPSFKGLNLTWATREGIGRHETPFDVPGAGLLAEVGLDRYAASSLESQVADIADYISYLTHDIHDALRYGVVTVGEFRELGLSVLNGAWVLTEGEFAVAHPEGDWTGVPQENVKYRRLHRHLIGKLVSHVTEETQKRAAGVGSLDEARQGQERIVAFPPAVHEEVGVRLKDFLYDRVYKSPLVARQNAKARMIIRSVFRCLTQNQLLLPFHVRERIESSELEPGSAIAVETAYFLAEQSDRGTIDLYKELHSPDDRAMGHHVT